MRTRIIRTVSAEPAVSGRRPRMPEPGTIPDAAPPLGQRRRSRLGPMRRQKPLPEPADKTVRPGERMLTIRESYNRVVLSGIQISFRTFGGRVENGRIPSEKTGTRRRICESEIDRLILLHRDYYTMREAFGQLAQHEKGLSWRTFRARVEKKPAPSIPSVKRGHRRWIRKDVIEKMKMHCDVSQAIEILRQKGIEMSYRTLDYRLYAGRVPYERMGGRRMISRGALDEFVQKELDKAGQKMS